MNVKVQEAILNVVESPLVLSCLEIAELWEPEDFANFSHTNVDILENYIRCRTSVMEIEDRCTYLTEEFIHHPDKFMFTPGIRNRLLKAAKLVSKDVYAAVFESNQTSDCDSNEMSFDSNNNSVTNTAGNNVPKLEPQIPSESNLFMEHQGILENQFLLSSVTNSSLVKQEDMNRSRHLQNIDKYYNDIVKNATKNFLECALQPEVDFHLSIPESDACSDLFGYYHCHFCTDRKKGMTKIKFRFSKYNSVIYTNINSHLKTHFQYVLDTSDRKRPKLSHSAHLLPSLLSDRENDGENVDSGNEHKLEIES